MSWCLEALKKYAVFGGRSRRKEYWYFVLFNCIVSLVLTAIESLTGAYVSYAGVSLSLLSRGYALATIVPSVALSARRLHRIDRSGWWLLAGFVPLIGS